MNPRSARAQAPWLAAWVTHLVELPDFSCKGGALRPSCGAKGAAVYETVREMMATAVDELGARPGMGQQWTNIELRDTTYRSEAVLIAPRGLQLITDINFDGTTTSSPKNGQVLVPPGMFRGMQHWGNGERRPPLEPSSSNR